MKRDWTEVKETLQQHKKLCNISEGDFKRARASMEGYEKHLFNVNTLVNRKNLIGLEANGVITECNQAIDNAKAFEDAINRLIADKKFLEE